MRDKERLANLLNSAGINGAVFELKDGKVVFPTIELFIEAEVKGTLLDDLLDEEGYQGLLSEAKEKLQLFRVDSGEVSMPMTPIPSQHRKKVTTPYLD